MGKNNKKVLFVHDGPLYIDKNKNEFFGIHYDNKLIERYSFLGEQVSFLMRFNMLESTKTSTYSKLDHQGFSFIPIPNFKSIRTYFPNRRIARKIIESAVAEHDIVVARLPSSAGTIAVKSAIRQKKPVLIELVACVYDALWNYDWRGKIISCYKLFVYKRIIRNSSHILYVTQHFLQRRYPSTGNTVGCSDVEIPPSDQSKLKKRIEKIGLSGEPIVLGTIGALNVGYKGQKDLIKTIGILKRKGKSFKYRLVGQGDPSVIKKYVRKNKVEKEVEIIGPLPHDQVFEFLENLDVYIQPSRVEGLPRAVVEAMSVACPCLGSDAGGIPELIGDYNIFKKGNILQMQHKLESINKSWMLEQAEKNFEKAKSFQTDILGSKRKEFYKQFLGTIES
jgi:glycosyltransferase involved in cell wall biosynthesis